MWNRFEGTELECYSNLLNIDVLNHRGGYNCCNVVIWGESRLFSLKVSSDTVSRLKVRYPEALMM